MSRLNYYLLVVLTGAGFFVGWVLNYFLVRRGYAPWSVRPLLAAVFAVLALFLLVQGRRVRNLVRGQKSTISPTSAFALAMAAQAAAYTAALTQGYLLALISLGLLRIEAPYFHQILQESTLNLSVTVALLIVGITVERWCVIDNSDQNDEDAAPFSSRGVPRT